MITSGARSERPYDIETVLGKSGPLPDLFKEHFKQYRLIPDHYESGVYREVYEVLSTQANTDPELLNVLRKLFD